MAALLLITDAQKGAAGRPLLCALIDRVLASIAIQSSTYAIDSSTTTQPVIMDPTKPSAPKLQVNGLASINENASPSTRTPTDRKAVKIDMLRKIRPPPFRYAWTFLHEKHIAAPAGANYEDRLTTLLENIITVKTFWEIINQFPLANLKMKDSVHFFKRGVRPVWEDPRNVDGGAWTFRVPKAISGDFWVEILLLAVGEQFADVLGKGMSLPQ